MDLFLKYFNKIFNIKILFFLKSYIKMHVNKLYKNEWTIRIIFLLISLKLPYCDQHKYENDKSHSKTYFIK